MGVASKFHFARGLSCPLIYGFMQNGYYYILESPLDSSVWEGSDYEKPVMVPPPCFGAFGNKESKDMG